MRKLLAVLMVFFGIQAMAGDLELWKKSALNKIIERGELIVGLEPGYMPFEMRDKQGNIIGFDVDMANEMAKEMGVKLTLVPTAWDGIIAGLLAGKYDIIISGMTITQERNLRINFANPYISVGQTLLVANKHAGKSWRDLDTPNHTIVTKLGVTGEIATRRMFRRAQIRTFETEADGAQELLNGNADAFVYDKPYNAIFMAEKGKGKIIHLEDELTYEPLGWAIRKGDPDFLNWLNNFLTQMKGDGRYDRIYDRWFNDDAWLKRVL